MYFVVVSVFATIRRFFSVSLSFVLKLLYQFCTFFWVISVRFSAVLGKEHVSGKF